MRSRVLIKGWIGWLGIVGFLVSASAEIHPTAAATCHALDRPTLGLDPVGFVPPGMLGEVALETGHPASYRPVPCSDDPASRPDHSSHLVGWLPPPPSSLLAAPRVAHSEPPAGPRPRAARSGRLDRPPRSA